MSLPTDFCTAGCWKFGLTVLLAAWTMQSCVSGVGVAQEKIDFGSQIKPILSDNCFACHGPDEAQRSTEFRLDQKESALNPEFDVIVPGQPESSLMVERIFSDDPDTIMPPSDHRKSLNATQKNLLRDWIEQGADWSEHWAFKPPTDIAPPVTTDQEWPRNEIDRYVLAKLERKRIQPSPRAEPHTLLRRLSFDLTGLPPLPEEVAQFEEAIASSGFESAYTQAVERLLASPHFGERMAVYWLDLVRYADTVGYHGDQNVSVSPFRDYVIEAFNSNLPFDQFTREQLAGDLLPEPTESQLIASGYNRLGMMSAEGGVQPEEYLNKYASDRVRTTASVWLGVTLGCAECHDHKFDPFSTREFYEFSAFFADIKEQGLYSGANQTGKWGPSMDVVDPGLTVSLEPIEEQIDQLQAELQENDELSNQLAIWENDLQQSRLQWQALEPVAITTRPRLKSDVSDDAAILVSGLNPKTAIYSVLVDLDPQAKAIRLEALPHSSLPKQGPGRAGNGNFVVTELIVLKGDHTGNLEQLQSLQSEWPQELQSQIVPLTSATATIEQTQGGEGHPDKKWSAASTIDQDTRGATWGWAVLPEIGKSHELVVQFKGTIDLSPQATVVIRQQHQNGPHTLGHFRLSQSNSADATADPTRSLDASLREILAVPKDDRTVKQRMSLLEYFISITPNFHEIHNRLGELRKQRETLVNRHTRQTLITVAVPPREIRVLARGNWMDKTGPVVSPSVPDVLGGPNWEFEEFKDKRPTRLELANWITDPQNPLTARVFVNRTWRTFFGNGISNVLDDLGSQGEPPSHPKLLDALSVKFVDAGWDIKALIREMVNSNTYQQSSSLRQDLRELDPENRLFARQARFRLDAEFIRDQALAASDLLVRKTGGKSVMPYQPPGLYRHLNFPKRSYSVSSGQDQYRRGVYTHWQRQYLHPAMKTFDAPAREECTAARPRSSTPLAALVMLNDPSYVEAARALADLAIQRADETPARIELVFQRAFSRSPTRAESDVIVELLDSHRTHFAEHLDEAKRLVAIGHSGDPETATNPTLAERAAWTSACRAIFNMHEFVLRK